MSASVGRGDEKWKPDLNKFDFTEYKINKWGNLI